MQVTHFVLLTFRFQFYFRTHEIDQEFWFFFQIDMFYFLFDKKNSKIFIITKY